RVAREDEDLVEVGMALQDRQRAILDEPGQVRVRMAPAHQAQGGEGADDVPDGAEPDEEDPRGGHRASIREGRLTRRRATCYETASRRARRRMPCARPSGCSTCSSVPRTR